MDKKRNWIKHRLSSHPYYKLWHSIISRCYNNKDKGYHNYGGRGITVCDEWRSGLKAFIDYVSLLHKPEQNNLTLDRIKNNEGYKPGNLRWVNMHIQNTNQRKRKDNISGYTGVSYLKKLDQWRSEIKVNRKTFFLGHHNTTRQAVNVRNEFIMEKKLNEYSLQ